MRPCSSMTAGLARLGLALFASAPASAFAAQTFAVEQPAIAIPLGAARLDLPAVVEAIELGRDRQVRFLANGDVPATLASRAGTREISVRFDEASAVAAMNGHARFSRTLHALEHGRELAAIAIESELDLYGLAAESPSARVIAASARVIGGGGGSEAVLATPKSPLELAAPSSSLALAIDARGLSGTIRLGAHLSPDAFSGDEAPRAVLQTFDDAGVRTGARALSFDVNGDAWTSREEPRVSIAWSKHNGRWVGAVSSDGAFSDASISRATITLGDATSAIVVQASGVVGDRSERAALGGPAGGGPAGGGSAGGAGAAKDVHLGP